MQRPGKSSQKTMVRDFPGGSVIKNLPANAGARFFPDLGKFQI